MATNPRNPSNPSPNEYSDAAATIRFEEPRKLPLGLLAGLAAGAVLVCLIVFFVMFKVNVGGSAPAAGKASVPPPAVAGDPVTSTNGKTIQGAVKESDGEISVSNPPSKCTYLDVHLKNLAELERSDPRPENLAWIEAKRNTAKQMMQNYGCK